MVRDVRRAVVAVLVVLAFLAWFPSPASMRASAATTVGGTLVADTTWNVSGSPYLVVADVVVPVGIALTIDPGVQVRFDTTPPASRSIRVYGTLRSVGTPALPILVTSDDPFPDRNDWVSILLEGAVDSVVEYTTLMWGSTTFDVRQSSPKIANNSILESGLRAIQVIGPGADPLIENNTIRTQIFNQRVGIFLQDASPLIRDNVLIDNYFGIYMQLGGTPRIENNVIRNGWRGVIVISMNPVLRNNTIEGNGLPNLGGYGILLFDAEAELRDNTIRDNGVNVDLPYNARRTLLHASGNTVNGVPLDTLYQFRARDRLLSDLVLDSGHTQGYIGNATQQGLLTLYDSVNVTLERSLLRNNGALVHAENSTARIVNSTLGNSTVHVRLASVSQVTTLNTSFVLPAVDVTDDRSLLIVRNFLHVRTVSEFGAAVPGVSVRVAQDGVDVSSGATDAAGWSRWHVAAYGVLSRGPSGPLFRESLVTAAVTHPQYEFQDTPRTVNLSVSREVVFPRTDLTPPRIVETIPAMDAVGVPFGSRITIVFSEPMDRSTTEAAIRVLENGAVDFVWDNDRTVSFRIRDPRYGATYYVEVRDTATDLAGNRLATGTVLVFDLEDPPRRVDLAFLWAGSLVILLVGLVAVLYVRLRARAEARREEQRDAGEERKA